MLTEKSRIRRATGEDRKKQGPIIMEDGKIIDLAKSMIGSKAIQSGMEYISKMSEGLSTGSLSSDEEYVAFRRKVMGDLIVEKSEEVRKNVEKEEREIKGKYSNASQVQADALATMQEISRQVAKDNTVTFYHDDDYNIIYNVGGTVPVEARGPLGGRYKQIDLKELKKSIDERNSKSDELRKKKSQLNIKELKKKIVERDDKAADNSKKIDEALNKFNSKNTKKKTKKKSKVAKPEKIADIISSKAKKYTTKKKIAKKKTTRAKKRDKR